MFGGIDGDGKASNERDKGFRGPSRGVRGPRGHPERYWWHVLRYAVEVQGTLEGYEVMRKRVPPGLWEASEEGRLPISAMPPPVQRAFRSCGTLLRRPRPATLSGEEHAGNGCRRVLCALSAPHVEAKRQLDPLVLHPTCSDSFRSYRRDVRDRARCRSRCDSTEALGLLRVRAVTVACFTPELTKSATRAEAHEVNERPYAAYASINRTCEQGMTEATGQNYQNLFQLWNGQPTRHSGVPA